MPRNSVQIEVGLHDQLRIRPRMGGGFHLLIGGDGSADERTVLSFPNVGKAEEVAAVLCTSAIAHGPLGEAVAATAPDKVVPFPAARRPTDPTPPAAA